MRPRVARFSVTSQGAPKLTKTIILAERVHKALVHLSDGSRVFTGCDENKAPLKGHDHAYILCESNLALGLGNRGEVTHVTVFAQAGFGPTEQEALQALQEVRGLSGPDVHLHLQGLGQPEDFGGLDIERGQSPVLALSKVWVSRTPFIPTRHPKVTRAGVPKVDDHGRQIGSPEHELRRLMQLEGFPEPVAVDTVNGTRLGEREILWSSFVCRRSNGEGKRSAYDTSYGFRIEFAEAARGPMALGYGAHFGMGGFVPELSEIR